jgi:hypothetical protein
MIQSKPCEIISTSSALATWVERPEFYLFVSLKNHQFTNELLAWYAEVCSQYTVKGYISVVDQPYLLNEIARYGRPLLEKEKARIFKISEERKRQVKRIIQKTSDVAIKLVSWEFLVQQTPVILQKEIAAAFSQKHHFYEAVMAYTQSVKSFYQSQDQLEKYAQFVLAELPVLINVYYTPKTGVVDFYPGENFPFFIDIEQGAFKEEIPETTAFIQESRPLVFVHVKQ